jgi:DNA replication protein DnaC
MNKLCQRCGEPYDVEPLEFAGRVLFDPPVFCDQCVAKMRGERLDEAEQERQGRLAESWRTICPPLYRDTKENYHSLSASVRAGLLQWNPEHQEDIGLIGPTGLGKTRLAFLKLKELHFAGHRCYAISAKRLEHMIAQSYDDDPLRRDTARVAIEASRTATFLLLDDVGKERFTERAASEFYDLMEHRTSHLLRTIWTTNSTLTDLENRIGGQHGKATIRRLVEFSAIINA